jgi:hydrogenase maturation protease
MNTQTGQSVIDVSESGERHAAIVVIGYGNPLRSDDGIGWRVAHELRSRLDTSRILVLECRQLAPELAEKLREAILVVFVDAAIEGFCGEVRHHRIDQIPAEKSRSMFSHGRTPAALLALAADLYAVAPEAHLFTVSGNSFRYGETLSPAVEGVLPSVIAEIEQLLSNIAPTTPIA